MTRAVTVNPFLPGNWSAPLSVVDAAGYRAAGHAMGQEARRLKASRSAAGTPTVADDMQRQIDEAVAAGRVTKCKDGHAAGSAPSLLEYAGAH